MRPLFLSILPLMILFIVSCGSDPDTSPTSEYYIRFKVDGIQKEYQVTNQPMGFSLDPAGPMYLATAVLLGSTSDGTRDFLSITVRNEEFFQENTVYQMQQPFVYFNVPMVRILLSYADEEGEIYQAALMQQEIPGMLVTDDAQLTFTNISDGQVVGDFEGVLLGPVSPLTGRGNSELRITEGQFSLPLINNIP